MNLELSENLFACADSHHQVEVYLNWIFIFHLSLGGLTIKHNSLLCSKTRASVGLPTTKRPTPSLIHFPHITASETQGHLSLGVQFRMGKGYSELPDASYKGCYINVELDMLKFYRQF